MRELFRVTARDENTAARAGILVTPHGEALTPAFVAVATRATAKALEPSGVAATGIQIAICNSYHLHLRPGEDVIANMGGLHAFSGWNHPMMTDSGGFQVFSLGAGKEHGVGKVASIFPGENADNQDSNSKSLVKLTEQGASFKSIVDGSEHFFSPEGVIELQGKLGADIILVLDECTSPLHDFDYTKAAMERTHRWARRSRAAFEARGTDNGHRNPNQVLYGIVQGGAYKSLRCESARIIGEMGFDGFAIGGSLGKSKDEMYQILDWTVPSLPDDRPRHLLGIGEISDIFAAVRRGVDTFDCALPTRIARNGNVFKKGAGRHRVNLRNARFQTDERPIDESCGCFTCQHHSRGYLRHLLRAKEVSAHRLCTIHNLWFMANLMQQIRSSIKLRNFSELEEEWIAS